MSLNKVLKLEEIKLLSKLKEHRLANGIKMEMARLMTEVAKGAATIEEKLEEMRKNLLKNNKDEFQYGSATNEKESRYEKRIPLETVSTIIDVPMNELMLYFLNGSRLCYENTNFTYKLGCVHFYAPRHESLNEAMTAHEKALKKGLTPKGWGRFANKDGKIVAKTVDGRLVPLKAAKGQKSVGQKTDIARGKMKAKAAPPASIVAPKRKEDDIPEYGSVVIPADKADEAVPALLHKYIAAGKNVTVRAAAGDGQGYEVFFEPQDFNKTVE